MPVERQRFHAVLAMLVVLSAAPAAQAQDFGPHVQILRPDTPDLQQRILNVYEAQQSNHFGARRATRPPSSTRNARPAKSAWRCASRHTTRSSTTPGSGAPIMAKASAGAAILRRTAWSSMVRT
ncbi:MAG TPA: hypothetical protein VGM81_04415 [Burkholderiaceae bacterium]|jgi:hypothetical protein